MERGRRRWLQLTWEAWIRDAASGGGLLAGGLAYRVFLWQLPATLCLVSLLGAVAELAHRPPEEVARSSGMTGAIAASVARVIAETDDARWWLIVVGLVLALWAGRGGARAVRVISQIAWAEPLGRKGSELIGSLAFSGFLLAAIAMRVVEGRYVHGSFVTDVVVFVIFTVVFASLSAWVMSLLPHGERHWTAVVPGALVFSLSLRGATVVTAYYLAGRIDRVDDLYGGLGIAIVALLFQFLAARLFVSAQFLNASLAGVGPRTAR